MSVVTITIDVGTRDGHVGEVKAVLVTRASAWVWNVMKRWR